MYENQEAFCVMSSIEYSNVVEEGCISKGWVTGPKNDYDYLLCLSSFVYISFHGKCSYCDSFIYLIGTTCTVWTYIHYYCAFYAVW